MSKGPLRYAGFLACQPPAQRPAVSKALELDETLAEAHGSDAYRKAYYDWDWAGADEEFKRSLALDPNNATVHHRYSRSLASRYLAEGGVSRGFSTSKAIFSAPTTMMVPIVRSMPMPKAVFNSPANTSRSPIRRIATTTAG